MSHWAGNSSGGSFEDSLVTPKMPERATGLPAGQQEVSEAEGVAWLRVKLAGLFRATGISDEEAWRAAREYCFHGLRVGAVSELLAAGVPPEVIKQIGAWASDAFLVYCKKLASNFLHEKAPLDGSQPFYFDPDLKLVFQGGSRALALAASLSGRKSFQPLP